MWMDYTPSVPCKPVLQQVGGHTSVSHKAADPRAEDAPFMNKMDEISYWVSTKQAPCLYNYDNVIKRRCEEANCSKPKSIHSDQFQIAAKHKTKRKLSLLDDDEQSVSSELQQNVYFDSSQNNKNHQITLDSFESDSLGSDLNFSLRKSSTHKKIKKSKINKSKTTVHKRNKLATSTPKANGNLRRSMRKTLKTNYSDQDNSFDMLNTDTLERINKKNVVKHEKSYTKALNATEKHTGNDRSLFKQRYQTPESKRDRIKDEPFDDISDLSGFTANYIRSTKINSSKKNRNRRRPPQNLIRGPGNNITKTDNAIIMRVNKAANTGLSKAPLVNCSGSSTNVLNLVTPNNTKPLTRVSRSTSLLKFIDNKHSIKKICNNPGVEPSNVVDMLYLQKKDASTRYPKRKNNSSTEDVTTKFEKRTPQAALTLNKRHKINNSRIEQDIELKNNPEILMSRTRSGKCLGLTQRRADSSVLVLNNSTEPISSVASMNVATPNTSRVLSKMRKTCTSTKKKRESKGKLKLENHIDSPRNSSGFAACFSDSEEENGIEKKKKFFC